MSIVVFLERQARGIHPMSWEALAAGQQLSGVAHPDGRERRRLALGGSRCSGDDLAEILGQILKPDIGHAKTPK